jgi:hypothetical protein
MTQGLVLDGRPGHKKPRCPELRIIQHELSTRSRSRPHRKCMNHPKVCSIGNLSAKGNGFFVSTTASEEIGGMDVV